MIRVKCPKCEKRLSVDEDEAGKIGSCPDCGQKFRIPAAKAAAANPDKGRPAKAAVAKKRPAPQAKGAAKPAAPPPSRPKEDWEEEDSSPYAVKEGEEQTEAARLIAQDSFRDKEYEQLRKKKERALKKEESRKNLASLGGLFLAWIALSGYAYWQPDYAAVPAGIGNLMSTFGAIWLIVLGFKEGALTGLLVWFIPFYDWYFAIKNFDIAGRAFIIKYVGLLIVGTVIAIVGTKFITDLKRKANDIGPSESSSVGRVVYVTSSLSDRGYLSPAR
jgi:hypothetical protein